MSDPSEEPWSNNPNAPQVPGWVHVGEKESLTGNVIGVILYGVVVALFFQCMSALLGPVDRIKGGARWGLVAHTVAMFLFLTISLGIDLHLASTFFIDGRDFPGDDETPPGPIGYSEVVTYGVIDIVFSAMFPLNQWLADGLLLHRCYVIYFMNSWVMAFPYLLYLSSVATGIAYVYQLPRSEVLGLELGTSYYSISLALNILLTGMIVTRLALHTRDIRKAVGASASISGSYTVIITMLVESYALYAVAFLVYIVPLALENWVAAIFSKLLAVVQVIAPYLIILRVAEQRALTSNVIPSGSWATGSIQFVGRGSMDVEGILLDGDLTGSMEVDGEGCDESSAGTENGIEEARLRRGRAFSDPTPH